VDERDVFVLLLGFVAGYAIWNLIMLGFRYYFRNW
jgi:hypothetical protein